MKAKTVAQVIAAEAGGKTRAQRFQSMLDIASAAYNRAKATGTTIKDVVSVKSQFNAYNSKMPAGTQALTSLAQQAISYVEENGPVHAGTYYATPGTVQNLPKGLVEIPGASPVHTVFQDPQNRAIITAAGTKRVNVSKLPDVAPIPAARPTESIAAAMPEPSAERFGTPSLQETLSQTAPQNTQMVASNTAGPWTGALSVIDRALAAQPALVNAVRPSPTPTGLPAARMQSMVASRPVGPVPTGLPAAPDPSMNWSGIGGMLGGWKQPNELSNDFGLAVPGNLASVRSLVANSMPAGRVKDDYAGTANPNRTKDDYAGPLGRVKDDAVARLQTTVAGRPSLPANVGIGGIPAARMQSMVASRLGVPGSLPAARLQSMVAGRPATPASTGLPAAPARPSAFDNFFDSLDYSRAPSLTSFAGQSAQFASDMGRYGQPANETAGLVQAVDRMSMAGNVQPSKAELAGLSHAINGASNTAYSNVRPDNAYSTPYSRPSPPASRPTVNVAAAPTISRNAYDTQRAPTRAPSVPAARPAAPSLAPQSNNLADYDANGNYTGAAKNPSVGFATNPSQLGGITMADPKFAPPTVADLDEALYPSVPAATPFTQQTITEAIQERTPTYTRPAATAYDVYSGLANTAMDNTGRNRVDSLPGGVTSVTNQYGATTGMTPGGYQTAVGSMPSIPGMSMPSKSTVGGAVKGGLVGAGVAGPVGGVIGALAGALAAKAIADQKKGAAPSVPGQTSGGLGGLFGSIFGGNTASKSGVSSGKSGSTSSKSSGSLGRGGSSSYGSNPNSNSLRY